MHSVCPEFESRRGSWLPPQLGATWQLFIEGPPAAAAPPGPGPWQNLPTRRDRTLTCYAQARKTFQPFRSKCGPRAGQEST
jgi:hypothetical protein